MRSFPSLLSVKISNRPHLSLADEPLRMTEISSVQASKDDWSSQRSLLLCSPKNADEPSKSIKYAAAAAEQIDSHWKVIREFAFLIETCTKAKVVTCFKSKSTLPFSFDLSNELACFLFGVMKLILQIISFRLKFWKSHIQHSSRCDWWKAKWRICLVSISMLFDWRRRRINAQLLKREGN